MPYPSSPFAENINGLILENQSKHKTNNENEKIQNELYLKELLGWLCTSPQLTSIRVNKSAFKLEDIRKLVEKIVDKGKVEVHPNFPDLLLLHHPDKASCPHLVKESNEVVVDVNGATAILRGAHVFAPGVIGMLQGAKVNDRVSIFADIEGKCKKGFATVYQSPGKLFIANGTIKMNREQLFGLNLVPSGIAIEVTERISHCPSINESLFPVGSTLLQNIPSVICVHALKVRPELTILDMCAAPGNKTTHISTLMQHKGILVAVDKTPSKVKRLEETCRRYGANALVFQADATKILVTDGHDADVSRGPPFQTETFDRILLDVPCSALGKRPQLSSRVTEAVLKSYVPLQRKLFHTAVPLLKKDGYLVYSTCTITLAENEAMVAWALRTFGDLRLVKPDPTLGGPGLFGTTLSETERLYVQRFGPNNVDSVGFFYALFIKV
ncbi:hypothetical protein PPYR_11869 [Photinus pyralis]|uniref:SAM-dependent MTase RsmB/NOP-type domain-containing protein n=1 Tax=Photinus pyralis TaxID=7054 RepID=A0A5N4ACH8_PHOPY|nr:putative methyltransferase NSUN6 [Photinus pyralis]KAB0795030.1 hypothetical protein PPYR_11869 [Photinus pyralis]